MLHRAGRLLLAVCLLLLAAVPLQGRTQSLESVLSPGAMTQAHVKWEDDCKSCHVPFERKAQERLCVDCHKDIGRDLAARTGMHGRIKPQPCRACHTEHKGRDMKIAPLDPRNFDHQLTDYALRGKHRQVECTKCHAAGRKYSEAAHDCASCHRKDDVHKESLGPKCANCHEERSWKETRFDHSKTRFALTGAHLPARCESCHKTREYKDTPQTCIGCHRKDDKHKAQFGEKCDSCHATERWKDIGFRHDIDTRYALRDRHRDVKCTTCHTGPLYRQKLGSACADCHLSDDRHKGSLGRECSSCHSERGWKEVQRFDHDRTAFPLLGRHVRPVCTDCHRSLVYRETSSTCVSCHRKDDRHEQTLGDRCGDCHTESDWKASRFFHGSTRFALKGAHSARELRCTACHKDQRSYRDTPMACISCHRKDDKHEAQLGERCDSCHAEQRWSETRFDHGTARFALSGAHLAVECKSCHKSLRYRDAARDCLGCHRKDDKHKAALGSACDSCHNVRDWKLWRFNHDRQTDYALQGAHAKVRCDACHAQAAPAGRKVAPLQRECVACHARDDVHDRGFGLRCEQCHQPTEWRRVVNQPAMAPPKNRGAVQ